MWARALWPPGHQGIQGQSLAGLGSELSGPGEGSRGARGEGLGWLQENVSDALSTGHAHPHDSTSTAASCPSPSPRQAWPDGGLQMDTPAQTPALGALGMSLEALRPH